LCDKLQGEEVRKGRERIREGEKGEAALAEGRTVVTTCSRCSAEQGCRF